jgi:PEP-CTERM motif
VTLRAGGTIAPGDPVTLTLQSSLTWDGEGLIRLVLGANSAASDQLYAAALVRGSNGSFLFDLVDAGAVVGQSYDLVHFSSLVGFAANDFSSNGIDGAFSLANGTLSFTAAAVPEPATSLLLLAGALFIAGVARQRLGGRSGLVC